MTTDFETAARTEGSWEEAAVKAALGLVSENESAILAPINMRAYNAKSLLASGAGGVWSALARSALLELPAMNTTYREYLADHILPLVASKQHDYGHDNILLSGIEGVRVRILDKFARYENLVGRGDSAQHESLVDTLDDIIGYCIIATMLDAGTFERPLARDMAPASNTLAAEDLLMAASEAMAQLWARHGRGDSLDGVFVQGDQDGVRSILVKLDVPL
jgi:hypothetical protein